MNSFGLENQKNPIACVKYFAWKRLSDGIIAQQSIAASKEGLLEAAGFGAVRMNEPLKGYLAMEVEIRNGQWIEKKG